MNLEQYTKLFSFMHFFANFFHPIPNQDPAALVLMS